MRLALAVLCLAAAPAWGQGLIALRVLCGSPGAALAYAAANRMTPLVVGSDPRAPGVTTTLFADHESGRWAIFWRRPDGDCLLDHGAGLEFGGAPKPKGERS